MYYIQALILTFIEALCCTLFFDTFCKRRKEKRIIANAGLFVLLFIVFIGISLINYKRYILKAILSIGLIGIIMLGKYSVKLVQDFFLAALYYGLIIIIDKTVLVCLEQAGIALDSSVNPNRAIAYALFSKNILLFLIYILNRRYKTMGSISMISGVEWIKLLTFPLITNLCMIALVTSDNIDSQNILMVLFCLFFLNILLLKIIEDIVKKEEEKREIQLFQERSKTQFDMYQNISDLYAQQRKYLHDVNNHFLCLQGLLKNGNIEEANNYLMKYCDSFCDEIDCINTNNVVINSILNQKYKTAKRKGIAVVIAVNDLQKVWLSDEDIVVILSNILDNAIEACEGLEPPLKVINFKCCLEGKKLFISCQNAVNNRVTIEDDNFVTSKKDGINHGFGIKNVKCVVDKYNGEDICSCMNGYFTHSIIINS